MSDSRRDDDDGYSRKERPSSFLPQAGEGAGANVARYRENYGATFGRGTTEPRRQSGSGAPPPPDATRAPQVKTPAAQSPDIPSSAAKADKSEGAGSER